MFGNKQELPQLRTIETSRFGNIQLLRQRRSVDVNAVPQVLRLHASTLSLKSVFKICWKDFQRFFIGYLPNGRHMFTSGRNRTSVDPQRIQSPLRICSVVLVQVVVGVEDVELQTMKLRGCKSEHRLNKDPYKHN